jgi:hypothetical protein
VYRSDTCAARSYAGPHRNPTSTERLPLSSLSERLKNDPIEWRPTQAGEILEGVILAIGARQSPHNANKQYYAVEILDDEDREWIWFAGQVSAVERLDRLQPLPGERLGVRYRGLGVAKPGQNAPKLFRILVDRPRPNNGSDATGPSAESANPPVAAGGSTSGPGETVESADA